jgi:hypothetical protein
VELHLHSPNTSSWRARPHVTDEGDGLQILRTAANMPYKHSRTADKGSSSKSAVGCGSQPLSVKSCMLRNVIASGNLIICTRHQILVGRPNQGGRSRQEMLTKLCLKTCEEDITLET